MKLFLPFLCSLAVLWPADAHRPKRDPELNRGKEQAKVSKLPRGVKITGDYTITWDAQKQVLRYTGKIRLQQGKNRWLESADRNAWVEILPNGTFRTSKGRWTMSFSEPRL